MFPKNRDILLITLVHTHTKITLVIFIKVRILIFLQYCYLNIYRFSQNFSLVPKMPFLSKQTKQFFFSPLLHDALSRPITFVSFELDVFHNLFVFLSLMFLMSIGHLFCIMSLKLGLSNIS